MKLTIPSAGMSPPLTNLPPLLTLFSYQKPRKPKLPTDDLTALITALPSLNFPFPLCDAIAATDEPCIPSTTRHHTTPSSSCTPQSYPTIPPLITSLTLSLI